MKKLILLGTVSLFLAGSAIAANYPNAHHHHHHVAPNRANEAANTRDIQHSRAWHQQHQARQLNGSKYHLGNQHHHPVYQHNYYNR